MDWPVLVSLDSNPALPMVQLNRPVCVIGARTSVHLELPSAQISKAHALLVQQSSGVYIRDLASTNRTYVNRRAIVESELTDGDVLDIGPFRFKCESGFGQMAEAFSAPGCEFQLQGAATRQVCAIRLNTFVIGSRRDCDLPLMDRNVGAAHAVIFARDAKRYLRDLSSGFGTRVNEKRVREVELNDGDVIDVGQTSLIVRFVATHIPGHPALSTDDRALFAAFMSDDQSGDTLVSMPALPPE